MTLTPSPRTHGRSLRWAARLATVTIPGLDADATHRTQHPLEAEVDAIPVKESAARAAWAPLGRHGSRHPKVASPPLRSRGWSPRGDHVTGWFILTQASDCDDVGASRRGLDVGGVVHYLGITTPHGQEKPVSLIKELLPIIGPAIIGVCGVVLGSAFVTTRRLRQDLVADTELLTRLKPGSVEHTELAGAIQRRTLHLVAAARNPALKSLDVVCWLIVLLTAIATAGCSFALWTIPTPQTLMEQTAALIPIVLLPGTGLLALATFRILWRQRMRSRVQYIETHLDPDEVKDSKRTLQVADLVWSFVGILIVGLSGAQLVMMTGIAYRWPSWLCVVLAVGFPFVAGLLLRAMTRFIESDEWQETLADTKERWAAQAEKAREAATHEQPVPKIEGKTSSGEFRADAAARERERATER